MHQTMKPAMGQIMAPPRVKEDSDPGSHPEAENVPPPGTMTVSNGDDASATSRLGMSPLKLCTSNEGRLAASPHKTPAYEGRPPSSPYKTPVNEGLTSTPPYKAPVHEGRPTSSPLKAPASEGSPVASPHKAIASEGPPTASPLKVAAGEGRSATTLFHKGSSSSPMNDCSRRRPMVLLHRLDSKKLRRRIDIERMGISEVCALRIRREMARGKRNCRRRYLRMMSRKRRTTSPRFGLKRRRLAEDEADAGKDVVDYTAAGEEFRRPLKKRNRGLSQLSSLPQPLHWSSQSIQPPLATSSPQIKVQPLSPSPEGNTHPLLSPSKASLTPQEKNHSSPQLQKKWYECAATPSVVIPLIPLHKYVPQASSSCTSIGSPAIKQQPCSSSQQVVGSPRKIVEPPKGAITESNSISSRSPPPLIPIPREDIPGTSHSVSIPHSTQSPLSGVYEVCNTRTLVSPSVEPPSNGPLQIPYVDSRVAAYCMPEDQQRTTLEMGMKTPDPPQSSVVLVPASMPENGHKSSSGTPPGIAFPTSPKLFIRKDLTHGKWISGGKEFSPLPVSPVPQPTTVLSPSPSTVPSTPVTPQHSSPSPRLEASQDLSLTSSVITHSASSATSSPGKPVSISSSQPVPSCLSLLIPAGVPLLPMSPLSANNTLGHNTVSAIIHAPVTLARQVVGSRDQMSSSVLRDKEDNREISYETKKSKAVKSSKQKHLESEQAVNGIVKIKIKTKKDLSDTHLSDLNSQTTPSENEEDPLSLSTATTLPSQESCTPSSQLLVNGIKECPSEDQPEGKSQAMYVAVISVTPTLTTITTTSITTTNTDTTTSTTAAATTTATTSPTSATDLTSIFSFPPSPVIGGSRSKKGLMDDDVSTTDPSNNTGTPIIKESTSPKKENKQESTKTPFIVTPKKRLRALLEAPVSLKGTPVSVVKHLSEAAEISEESKVQARSSIIQSTSEAVSVESRSSESGLEKPEMLPTKESKEIPSPPTPPSTLADSKKAAIWNPLTSDSTIMTTTKESTDSREGSPLEEFSPADTRYSPVPEKEQLKNLVVRVERLTKESFTDAFLATHNVSASCAARLCRHLKVLQGAGQYHRPLNRKKIPIQKVVPVYSAPRYLPSPKSLPPLKSKAASRLLSAPRASPDPSYGAPPSSSSSTSKQKSLKLMPPMPLAKLSEAAGILHINSLKKRRLLVFRNKRLEPHQTKLLQEVGLSVAKKASRNSTLDRMGVRGPILDPGYFGIKGSARPSKRETQENQDSQDIPSPNVTQGQPHLVQQRQSQPSAVPQDGHVYLLQQQQLQQQQLQHQLQKQRQLQKQQLHQQQLQQLQQIQQQQMQLQHQQHHQQHHQQQHQQQQYLSHVPPGSIHARTVVPPATVRGGGGPQPAPRPPVMVYPANQGTKLVVMDQQGRLREAMIQRGDQGYTVYPVIAPQQETWTNSPQVTRDPHAPPLTFMGNTGMGAASREPVQQSGIQPTALRPPPPRPMPPPLSFMGHTTETNSWPGSQQGQQPAGSSWPHATDHSLRNYPVINYNQHPIPDKAAQPTYFVRGPPPPYPSRPSHTIQGPVFQRQLHPSTTMAITSGPGPSNQQAAVVWQGVGVPQRQPHPQGHPHRITTTAVCHPPQGTGVAPLSTDHSGMRQQVGASASVSAVAAAVPGVVQGETLVSNPQVAADPGSRATPRPTTTTTTTTTIPGTFTSNSDHQCHQTWLPEVMAVVEALLLQLVDAGLPTKDTFIIHTVRQLLFARSAMVASPAFCCPDQERRWYNEFCTAHSHRLKAQEQARAGRSQGMTQDEVKEWLARLKVEMTRFHGVQPQRIFYMHELNFFLDQQTREVKYHRMFPGPPMQSPGSKDTVSVLFIIGADGQLGPGMIIFPRMVIPERLFESLRSVAGGQEWVLGSSVNGWLTQDCVLEFVSDVFVPWLKRRAIHFPVALFSSDSISGVAIPAADRFITQGVQLIALPRQAAGVLSPAEWMWGYTLRWQWGKVVRNWSNTNDNKPLLEENFASFIIGFLTSRAIPDRVSHKFENCGLWPFNAQAVFQFLLKYQSMSKASKNKVISGSFGNSV